MHLPWRLAKPQAWSSHLHHTTRRSANASVRPIQPQCQTAARTQTSRFSTSPILSKKNPLREQKDPRITLIRYFLFKQPRNPRPLRFSRLRYLRHWTIHRAWMLHKRKLRREAELDLERQYWAMNKACEELRLMGADGLPGGRDEGRLFRIAMRKEGIWQGVPIEYARMQTEWPAREGWNHGWVKN